MFTLRPVYGEDFLDREELLEELVTTLSSPREEMGFALVGPRRMGKTSLFVETVRRLREVPGVVPVYLSLWELVEGTPEEPSPELLGAVLEAFRSRGRSHCGCEPGTSCKPPWSYCRSYCARCGYRCGCGRSSR